MQLASFFEQGINTKVKHSSENDFTPNQIVIPLGIPSTRFLKILVPVVRNRETRVDMVD